MEEDPDSHQLAHRCVVDPGDWGHGNGAVEGEDTREVRRAGTSKVGSELEQRQFRVIDSEDDRVGPPQLQRKTGAAASQE